MSQMVSRVQRSFVCEMSQHLSRLGSLPDPSANTHSNYQSPPILAHELQKATCDSDDLNLGSIVEWAGNRPPPAPGVVHTDHTQVYCRNGWTTRLWVGLKGAI